MRYELFADEAWTHTTPPLNRYWCFFGGFLASEAVASSLSAAIRTLKTDAGVAKEVGWKNLATHNLDLYKSIVDTVCHTLDAGEIVFRQQFLDRRFVYEPPDGIKAPGHPLDVQFKLYYQFIKHMFAGQYLPVDSELTIRLDTHSSQRHKDDLASFICLLPKLWARPDLVIRVKYHRSAKIPLIQAADLLMGAAGSYGNKKHQLRDGRRGMSPKQKLRLEMAKYIYNALRRLDAAHRGTKAFSWFESTGGGWDPIRSRSHPIRIWKFKPSRYRLDDGWTNKNLDKEGRYVSPEMQPEVNTV